MDGRTSGFKVGSPVCISGLQSAAGVQLNGQSGVLSGFISVSGRWNVRLDSGEEKAIKADNLIPKADAHARATQHIDSPLSACTHGRPELTAEKQQHVNKVIHLGRLNCFDAVIFLATSKMSFSKKMLDVTGKAILAAAIDTVLQDDRDSKYSEIQNLHSTYRALRWCIKYGCKHFLHVFQNTVSQGRNGWELLEGMAMKDKSVKELMEHVMIATNNVKRIEFIAGDSSCKCCAQLIQSFDLEVESPALQADSQGMSCADGVYTAFKNPAALLAQKEREEAELTGKSIGGVSERDVVRWELLKDEGNRAYSVGDLCVAVAKYSEVVKAMTASHAVSKGSCINDEVARIYITCLANRAQAQLKRASPLAPDTVAAHNRNNVFWAVQFDCETALEMPAIAQYPQLKEKVQLRLEMARDAQKQWEAEHMNSMRARYEEVFGEVVDEVKRLRGFEIRTKSALQAESPEAGRHMNANASPQKQQKQQRRSRGVKPQASSEVGAQDIPRLNSLETRSHDDQAVDDIPRFNSLETHNDGDQAVDGGQPQASNVEPGDIMVTDERPEHESSALGTLDAGGRATRTGTRRKKRLQGRQKGEPQLPRGCRLVREFSGDKAPFNSECPFCLDEFQDSVANGSHICMGKCRHAFCVQCVLVWERTCMAHHLDIKCPSCNSCF